MPVVPGTSINPRVEHAVPQRLTAKRLPSGTPSLNWNPASRGARKYRRAKFGAAEFYVDTTVRDSARRIVQHEFPKRDAPYAEDMGRRAREITIRGYCIVFSNETSFPSDKRKKRITPDRATC